MNTARYQLGGRGTQTATLAFGGRDPVSNATEEYDGTSWATNPATMNTARANMATAGTNTLALSAGGSVPPVTAATEEFTGPGVAVTKTITVS
jgi:hypothetical protein